MTSLGIVVVSFGNTDDILQFTNQVQKQLRKGDKLVVVDNKPGADLAGFFSANSSAVEVIEHNNGGFGAGANFGAQWVLNQSQNGRGNVDVILLLNPDMQIAQDDFLDRMRIGADKFDAWQGVILNSEDELIQAAFVPLHITGISYSGMFGKPLDMLSEDMEVSGISGGCFAVKSEWWIKSGGMCEPFFMYYEDRDLSTRLKLMGAKLGVVKDAHILHDYEFQKLGYKWKYLELNRLRSILITFPTRLIVLTLVPNLCFNFLIFLQYLFSGKPLTKISADLQFLHDIPWCLRQRKKLKSQIKTTRKEFFSWLDWAFDSTQMKPFNSPIVNACFHVYYKFIRLFA
ncbi:hypothetical protein FACS1894125_5060 [Actinomycetota bacterium]|nr:hypothetical protein FACS1894125_5060 [Actinomycetota bacterium]